MGSKPDSFEHARQAIISAASGLMVKSDAHATSLADIAKSLKMSKGTLYYYYSSKEQLIIDVAEYHLASITERIFAWIDIVVRGTGAPDALRTLIEAILGEDEMSGKLHLTLLHEAAMGNETLQKRFAAKYREWSVMIEVGAMKALGTEAERFKTKLYVFLAAIDGFLIQRAIGIDKLSREDIVEAFV